MVPVQCDTVWVAPLTSSFYKNNESRFTASEKPRNSSSGLFRRFYNNVSDVRAGAVASSDCARRVTRSGITMGADKIGVGTNTRDGNVGCSDRLKGGCVQSTRGKDFVVERTTERTDQCGNNEITQIGELGRIVHVNSSLLGTIPVVHSSSVQSNERNVNWRVGLGHGNEQNFPGNAFRGDVGVGQHRFLEREKYLGADSNDKDIDRCVDINRMGSLLSSGRSERCLEFDGKIVSHKYSGGTSGTECDRFVWPTAERRVGAYRDRLVGGSTRSIQAGKSHTSVDENFHEIVGDVTEIPMSDRVSVMGSWKIQQNSGRIEQNARF